MESEVKALFLASHPALDFLNTTYGPQGSTSELIGDGEAFLAWLVEAGQLAAADVTKLRRRYNEKSLDVVAAEARKVRHWAADWIERWRAAPGGDYTSELRRLNALLARGSSYHEVVPAEAGWQLVEHAHLVAADALIALVAAPLARLIAHESPELVRRCAGTACTLWFLDRTKSHRRLFCSPAACGNRTKVAAYRERQRER